MRFESKKSVGKAGGFSRDSGHKSRLIGTLFPKKAVSIRDMTFFFVALNLGFHSPLPLDLDILSGTVHDVMCRA